MISSVKNSPTTTPPPSRSSSFYISNQSIIPRSCLIQSTTTSESSTSITTTSPPAETTSSSSASSILSNITPTPTPTPVSNSPPLDSEFSFLQSSSHSLNNYVSNTNSVRKSSAASYEENFQDIWFSKFNRNLTKLGNGVYKIDKIGQLSKLLYFYYHQRNQFNPTYNESLFPYLHGNHNSKLSQIKKLNLNNIMFINSDTSSEFTPDLLNTVNPNQILHKKNHKWEFSINNGDDDESGVSNCRNFGDQIKLMAPLSHFVVYNYSFTNNHEITSILNQVVDTHFGNFIYSVEINENWWEYIDASYFDNDDDESLIYNNPVISEILSSSDVHSEPYASQGEHFVSRYHRYEQNLIWKMNSKKWILNNKICIGNILDYNELVSTPHDKSNDFKLIIYCDDNIEDGFCQFPTLDSLQWIWHDYMSGNNLNNIYCFKMPQLGGRSNIINSDELIILLNILKLVEKISRVNKIFIGSHDGFTGSSVLLVLIMQLLDKKIISESILSLAKANVKMFFFNHDIRLLNELEIFVDYLNKHLIQEFPTIILPDSVDLDAIDRFYYINPIIKPQLYDWFENFSSCSSSINLPSRILDHLYLGNLNHASSSTILETLQIDKVISIDELPSWWKPLNKTIQFDFELPTTQSTIIKPIYRYNNTKIYEVQFSKYHLTKPIPSGLKSLIYIHNFKDDGIDSILPLLLDSPPSIQEKLLLNPNYPIDTSTTTLIHCKIGVSRSVSLILAILMKQKRISLIQSYLLVRILRFNLIIQPNLKIFYELYMFEKYLGLDESGSFQNGKKIKKWNWEFICGEIHKLNQIYSSG